MHLASLATRRRFLATGALRPTASRRALRASTPRAAFYPPAWAHLGQPGGHCRHHPTTAPCPRRRSADTKPVANAGFLAVSHATHSFLRRGHGMWSSLPAGAVTSAALSVDQPYRGFFTSAAAAGAASAGLQCPAARRAPLPALRLPRVHRPLHRVPVQAGAPAAGM